MGNSFDTSDHAVVEVGPSSGTRYNGTDPNHVGVVDELYNNEKYWADVNSSYKSGFDAGGKPPSLISDNVSFAIVGVVGLIIFTTIKNITRYFIVYLII